MYPNIFYIFSKLLLENNGHLIELKKDFLKECNDPQNSCDEKENELSEKEHPKIDVNVKQKMTKNPSGSTRCIKCFKYNPYIATIQLTQQIFKKYQVVPIDLFSIETCFDKRCIETSKITFTSLISNGYNYDMLMLTHTPIKNISILLQKLSDTWNKETQTEEECYMIHWLFCNATPFLRGSAGCSKVLLNAILFKNGQYPVKETVDFHRQTDWVAMFSPTFDIYWRKKDELFEKDGDFSVRTFLIQNPGQIVNDVNPKDSDKMLIEDAFRSKAKKSNKKIKIKSKGKKKSIKIYKKR
jgi:hypothetical protein